MRGLLIAIAAASISHGLGGRGQGTARASAQGIDTSWHAPLRSQINNLTSALNANGVYGFIFNSSITPDEDYGTYNWCNMPHVRAQDYVRPDDDFQLQYVEVMQRHHKRTPYASNAFPVESYRWDCDDVRLFLYGEGLRRNRSTPVYRQGYTSSINPFVPSGWIGSCSFPQITAGGLDDSWLHGADLYAVYHDLLGFIPSRHDNYKAVVKYRVTNNVITSQVAGMIISGMWSTTLPSPVMIQALGVDSLEPQYPCAMAGSLFEFIKSSSNPEWEKHLNSSVDIFRILDDISGVPPNDDGFHISFDHYYDNLSARQCHGKPLPCKLVKGRNSTTCISQELANTVYRMGNWEYSQIYRDHPSSLLASVLSLGVWIAELTNNIQNAMDQSSDVRFFHNIAHDGSVSRLLSILQVDQMVWPGMGSEVVVELYKHRGQGPSLHELSAQGVNPACHRDEFQSSSPSGHYVRVLFGGKILTSSSPSLGRMNMLPAEVLLGYLRGLLGTNISSIQNSCQQ